MTRAGFRPHRVIAFKPSSGDTAKVDSVIPLLSGKTARGSVTTYVCENFTCGEPLIGVEAIEKALGA